MARPSPTSIRLDPDLKMALEKAATNDGRSMANLIDRILREWLRAKDVKSGTPTEADEVL